MGQSDPSRDITCIGAIARRLDFRYSVAGRSALAYRAGAVARADGGGQCPLSAGAIGCSGLDRLRRDVRAVLQALAVLRRLHPGDDQALDLGRPLEQLVDLGV